MRKILIIDGEGEFIEMVSSFLEVSNFSVASASSAEEGLEQVVSFGPDLILLARDLMGESGELAPEGLAVLRGLKSNPGFKKVPVIFLVKEASERDLQRLKNLKHKAEDYARKPISDSDLLRRIENLIGFDPSEVEGQLGKEKGKVGSAQKILDSKPDIQEAGEREIQELLNRLGEELSQSQEKEEDSVISPSASREELRRELELVQGRVREREERYQRMREKWKKALVVMEERILKLGEENQRLDARLSEMMEKEGRWEKEKEEMIVVLEKVRELILKFENFKEALVRDTELARELFKNIERLKDKG